MFPDPPAPVPNGGGDLPPTLIEKSQDDASVSITILVPGEEPMQRPLGIGSYVLGLAEDCDIAVRAEGVSRRHARLTISLTGWAAEDVGSTNGTTVGGRRVEGATRLWPGQEIEIGSAKLRLQRDPGKSGPTGTENARKLLPEDRRLLHRYDIGRLIAEGGMGAVLDVRDGAMERKVAMKVMLTPDDPEALSRAEGTPCN